MASIKVEITSKEMIKPSSPTPHHLKTLKLSIIDQHKPLMHPSLTFLYPYNNSFDNKYGEKISTLLKRSLSNTLVYFYPLAGRLEAGNVSINCNDEGVAFNEAYVSIDLSKVVENPNLEELMKLRPFGLTEREDIMLGVQLNRFSCGGIAISVCISHKISDGKGFLDFPVAWATITRAIINGKTRDYCNLIRQPKFNGASHFPPRCCLNEIYPPSPIVNNIVKPVTRRFLFDKKMIEKLRNEIIQECNNTIDASSSKGIKSLPTRTEAVTIFIWKIMMEAYRVKSGPSGSKIWAALMLIDLRTRMTPSMPEDFFGNASWYTIAPALLGPESKKSELINILRGAIKRIDNHFIDKGLQNGEYALKMKEVLHVFDIYKVSSICRFPIYEVDFGWGKPIWVAQNIMPANNSVLMSSTSCGQGIEAWVNMASNDHIALLQHQHHLLSHNYSYQQKSLM